MTTPLCDRSWTDLVDCADDGVVLAIPLGSTEQHGPHLPLSTDTDIAVALCAELATRRSNIMVAPAVPYGSSGEHAGFAGTLSIGQAALELLLVELVRSATETFAAVLIVSGHGGNSEAVGRAVSTLAAEGHNVLVFQPRAHGDAHAGRVETSLQLHLRPWTVAYERAEPGNPHPLGELLPELRRNGVRAVSPNGVLGDPAGASSAEGARLFSQLLDDLCARVAAWRSQ